MLEEIYVFVDMPEPSFGLQLVYTDGINNADIEVVRDGDAVLLPEGVPSKRGYSGRNAEFCLDHGSTSRSARSQVGVVQVDSRYA
jgi:5-deoxy-glucuronate isomerase